LFGFDIVTRVAKCTVLSTPPQSTRTVTVNTPPQNTRGVKKKRHELG
jgi:hypothetical protein